MIAAKKSAKVKKDLLKLRDDFIFIISSPFRWDIDQINYFLILLAILTVGFFVDGFVRDYIKSIHSSFFDEVFALAHLYGKPPLTIFSFIIFYITGLILIKDNFRIIGLKIFESFIFSGIIITIVKSIFGRWRPYTEKGFWAFSPFTIGPNDHLSFPSGDVAVAFAFSVIIAGIFDNIFWKIFWYLLAILTSLGRIYHDQHWLSDVITAAAISIYIGIHVNKIHQLKTNSEV
ncbi:MAG: phosphatase PAP2 family protein [Ignavibacteriaceae bacterium]